MSALNPIIQILDKYTENKAMLRRDYTQMISEINTDYAMNNFSCEHMIGRIVPSNPALTNSYDIWKSTHVVEPQIINNIFDDGNNVANNPSIIIDTNIETISDLLKIINENEYDSTITYNIDLKSLHKIKPELLTMDNMVGLENFKKSVTDQLLYFLQGLHKIGDGDYKHTIIYGPPGTGKTQIAKIMGSMYAKVGILEKNKFKKVTRSDLVAGYLGQTAIKTRDVINECLGGVLFIDEVYSLGSQIDDDNYSKECIDTICECLSDHKNKLMVIVAGYEKDIKDRFLSRNNGMESRFIWKFKMDEYTYEDLYIIFKRMVESNGWVLDNDITNEWFKDKHDKFKAYGRDMEKLFSYCKICHGRRIYGKDSSIRLTLTNEDLNAGLNTFEINQMKDPNESVRKQILNTLYM